MKKMIKEWNEKGGEERGEGAKVSRVEYKHSRDYKVALFCLRSPSPVTRGLQLSYASNCVFENRQL